MKEKIIFSNDRDDAIFYISENGESVEIWNDEQNKIDLINVLLEKTKRTDIEVIVL